MKASELRIGNYIQDRGDKIWAIDHWENSYKVASKTPIIYVDETFGEMPGHPLTEEIKYVKPIPLTEEWLLKFGFEEDRSEINTLKKGRFKLEAMIKIITSGELRSFYYKHISVKHVHQLQNLYFALTNYELNIEDE